MIGKPVTGSQIQRIVTAVRDKDTGLAIALNELFHQAELYGINVQRDESGQMIREVTTNGTQNAKDASTAP